MTTSGPLPDGVAGVFADLLVHEVNPTLAAAAVRAILHLPAPDQATFGQYFRLFTDENGPDSGERLRQAFLVGGIDADAALRQIAAVVPSMAALPQPLSQASDPNDTSRAERSLSHRLRSLRSRTGLPPWATTHSMACSATPCGRSSRTRRQTQRRFCSRGSRPSEMSSATGHTSWRKRIGIR